MRYAIAIVLLALAVPAVADELDIYESIDDVTIGRVFLTPAERRWLDANRNVLVRERPVRRWRVDDAPSGEEPAPASDPPAGFIINSSGAESRWSRGDFVDVDGRSVRSMQFPGDVNITRHDVPRTSEAEEREEPEDDESPQ